MSRIHLSPTESWFTYILILALCSILTMSISAQTMSNYAAEEQTWAPASPNFTLSAMDSPDHPKVPSALNTGTGSDPGGAGHPAGYAFPSSQERRKVFLTDFVGPGAFIDPAFQAAFDQVHSLKVGYPRDGYPGSGAHPEHGEVPEWSEGLDGYSKRYASRFGMGLMGTTSRYGIGELLHQDVSYHPCQCTGTLQRAYHAVTQSLIAHTNRGKGVLSLPAFASPYIAAEIATLAWYPARYKASDALRTSTSLYFGLPIKNLMNEFKRH
jgi:hypothetical protein